MSFLFCFFDPVYVLRINTPPVQPLLGKELTVLMTKKKAEAEKSRKDKEKKQEEALREKAAQADGEAKMRIAHARQSLSFTVNWSVGGHPAVVIYETVAAAVGALFQPKSDSYAAP